MNTGPVTTQHTGGSGPYWDGAARGVLVVQRCDNCGALRHYPRVLCDVCYCFGWTPTEIAPHGEVFAWTITHHPFDPAFADDVPYTLVTVTMDAGVRVLGRMRDPGPVRIGLRVELTFGTDPAGAPMPVFTPAPV